MHYLHVSTFMYSDFMHKTIQFLFYSKAATRNLYYLMLHKAYNSISLTLILIILIV